VGKSRATVALAEAGATRSDWFGLKVYTPFRTPIAQSENGRYRLKQEFAQRNGLALEGYVRVTPPPLMASAFHRAEFRDQLTAQIDSFDPAVVIVAPWSAAVRDDKAKGYLEAFDARRRVIPAEGCRASHRHRGPHAEAARGRAGQRGGLAEPAGRLARAGRCAALRFCAAKRQR
jgi:hypothetical protein